MSINNLNKINLFEMKHKNRYAQLVEAQSPASQEVEAEVAPDVQVGGYSGNLVDSDKKSAATDLKPRIEINFETNRPNQSENSSENPMNNKCHKLSIINDEEVNNQEAPRKSSQCSSQMSTSFVSNSATNQPSTSSDTGVASYDPISRSSSVQGTNLTRTISQSMFELDSSSRMEKFEISWKNLSFSYKPKFMRSYNKKSTHVLRDVSGKIQSNQLIAVIGPSGCGKTTMLQFLAGNNPSNQDKLKIVGLDEPKVAFIGQGDCLLPGLTVRETLMYASRLQNTDNNFNHQQHIEPILRELGLIECSDRSVTKLSGGQAKRVTIAQELLYPTNLLILDEVTSGLDTSTSYSIVKLLKQLVSDNEYPMSIIMSIHQPSAKLFSIFDQVYLMSEGCCIYEGSCKINIINTYLRRFNLECPKFHNIADYLIEIASEEVLSADNMAKEQMIQFQRKRSQMQDDQPKLIYDDLKNNDISNNKLIDEDKSQKIPMLNSNSLYEVIAKARSKRERPIYNHLFIHFSRSILRIRRSSILTYLQLITYILLGLQLATFYGSDIGKLSGCPRLPVSFIAMVFSDGIDDDNVTLEMRRIQENMNFLLVAIMTATFAALEITVITFPLEAKTIKREWRNGWYRVSSYFIGRTLADLPFQMAFVFIFCIVIYTMTGQIGLLTWRFSSFVTIIMMTALIAQTVGFIFGALFMDNLPAAVFTAPLCIFPALLFSGFFSRVSQIPPFYKPMTFLSHFRYAFDTLIITLYGYDRCNCDQATLNSYHQSLQNQTSSIKDMFRSLFGTVDCEIGENSGEDSIENKLGSTIQAATNPIEDALVDSLFQHMKSNQTSDPLSADSSGSAMDHLVYKFSNRVTKMFNSQSNFGHQIPERCQDFNSYLMMEFDLHSNDLMFGLTMLFFFVLFSRLLCNTILTHTIATRIN